MWKWKGTGNKDETCTLTIEGLKLNSSAVYFCAASLHSETHHLLLSTRTSPSHSFHLCIKAHMTLAQGVNHSNLSKTRDCKRRSFLWSDVTTLHDAVTYEDSNTFWLIWILPPSNKTFSHYVSFFCGLQVIYNTNRPLNIKTLHQITHVLVIVDFSFFCLLITWW